LQWSRVFAPHQEIPFCPAHRAPLQTTTSTIVCAARSVKAATRPTAWVGAWSEKEQGGPPHRGGPRPVVGTT